MGNRLWVVSELYYPEMTSTGYILTRLAEGLAAHGNNVGVLCCQPTYYARGTHAPSLETRNGVAIRRCPGTTLNKDILLFRLVNLVTITVSLFFNALWRLRRGDRVLVVTNPPSLPFLIAVACSLRGAHCILLIHDVYPELLVAVGKLRASHPLVRGLGWLSQILYRKARHVVVLGRDMQAQITETAEIGREHVSIITNWADLDQVAPGRKDDNVLLGELRIRDKFVLEYAGNIGYPNDVESIVEAAGTLSGDGNVHFLFIGSGAKRRWLEDAIERKQLANVSLLPSRPREDQKNFLNACDVALVSLVSGMKGISVPSRMYNIMAAGKPIIAITEPQSELALAVEEEDMGWVVPPGNADRLVNVIREARSAPLRLADMGNRARKAAESKYAYEQVLRSYVSLFKRS